MATSAYSTVLILLVLAVLSIGHGDAQAGATPVPAETSAPVMVATTLDIQSRDDSFPLLSSTLTIRVPADWPEAAQFLADAADARARSSALGALLVRVGLASPDDPEGAVMDLVPSAPEIRVDGGFVTLSGSRAVELRDDGGADLGLWRVDLGPCAVIERSLPETAVTEADPGIGTEEDTGPRLFLRINQRCDLHLLLESPGAGLGDEGVEAVPDSALQSQLVADVWIHDSRLVSATPMPELISDGRIRWTFGADTTRWAVDAQLQPPALTRLRFKLITGFSTLQPFSTYLGPAVVLVSGYLIVARRIPAPATGSKELPRIGRRMKRVTKAALFLLGSGISSWYALLWFQDWAGGREDWLAWLYLCVAGLPCIAFGILAATVGELWSLERRWPVLTVVTTLVVGLLVLMVPLSIDLATADFEAPTFVRDHEIVRWLSTLIPLLTTALIVYAIIWPVLSLALPSRDGVDTTTNRVDGCPLWWSGLAIILPTLVVVASWLLFEWSDVLDLVAGDPGVSKLAMLQSVLVDNGLFFAFELVSEVAAVTPLIALVLTGVALRQAGFISATEPSQGDQDQRWVWRGLAFLFAASVVGYGGAVLGIQLPIGFLVALAVLLRGRPVLAKWSAIGRRSTIEDAREEGGKYPRSTTDSRLTVEQPVAGEASEIAHDRRRLAAIALPWWTIELHRVQRAQIDSDAPPASVAPVPTPKPSQTGAPTTWWENGVWASRWGAWLALPMLALFLSVLLSDEGTRWFELSPSFRLVKLLIVVANEAAMWIVAAFVLGCLYTSLPGRFGWMKGLMLALVYALAHGAGLLARLLTGEGPKIEWVFRPLQVALFLMVIGVALEFRRGNWAAPRAFLARPFPPDHRWAKGLVGVVGYLSPVAVTMIAVTQQILSGDAAAAMTEVISALPDIVSPLGRSG